MPLCVELNEAGYLVSNGSTDISNCTQYVLTTVDEYNYFFSYTQITSSEATAYFAGGYALVFVGGYLMTYAIQQAIKFINTIR